MSYVYTDAEARALLAGFEVVSIRNDHIFPYVVADYVEHRYRKPWWFRVMPDPAFAVLCGALGWHKLIRARKPL